MTFKTWINDLRNVQSVINNISNTRVIIDGATGLLNTNSLKEMSSAVSGLSKEQALLVLSTKNLNAAQQEQVLLAAGIISSENSITASAISQALAKTQLSATEKEALLTKLGLIDATTGEAIANATCTKEELLKVLATKGIIGADADAIISSIGLTSANSAQAISFDLLTASIWANIKALGKWLITNPVGWAILGGTAILGLVKAYDALTDSVEEVQERTDKLLDSYNSAISEANSNAKTIESLADRYGELSKGVNNLGENVSLTSDEYSEYKSIVDQIAEMFPTLITGYTDEGTAILSLKGNVEKLRDAYKEAQTEAYNLLIVSGEDSDGNDIISNYKNQVNGNESWLSKQSSYIDGEGGVKDAIDIITKLTGVLTPDEFRDTYNELYKQYKNIWNSDKIQDALKSSGFEELSHAPKWGELTNDDLASVKSTAQATIQTYKAEIDSQLKNVDTLANAYLMTNEDYSKLDEQSQTAASLIVNNLTEDIANGFKTKEDVGAYVANIVSKIKDNPDLNKSLVDLFTEDFSSMSVDEAKSKLNGYINTIAEALDEDPVELKVRLGFDDYNDEDIAPLKTKVQGFLKDEFDDKVGELSLDDLQIASKLEIPEGTLLSWDELKQKIEEAKNAIPNETPTSFKKAWKDLDNPSNDDYKNTKKEILELAEAGKLTVKAFKKADNGNAEKYFESLGISAEEATKKINDTIDSAKTLSSLKTSITSIRNAYTEKKENKVAGADTLGSMVSEFGNLKSWKKYKETLGSTTSTLKECRDAQNELATEYINSNAFLNGLNDIVDATGKVDEATKSYYINQLKDVGIKNAEEIVNNRIGQQLMDIRLKKANVIDMTEDEIDSLISECSQYSLTEDAIKDYIFQKALASENALDTSESVDNLITLAKQCGATAETISYLMNLQNVMANIDTITASVPKTMEDYHSREQNLEALNQQAKTLKDKIDKSSQNKLKVDTNFKGVVDPSKPDKGGNKDGSSKSSDTKTEIDWIERKINSLQTRFDRWKSRAENSSLTFLDTFYKKAAKYAKNLMNSEATAYSKYLAKANKVKISSNKKTDASLKNKIRNGAIKGSASDLIREYGSKTADKIQKYQDYYDKATSALDSFISKADELYNLPLDRAAAKVEKFNDSIELLEKKLDNAIGATNKNKIIDSETTEKENQVKINKAVNKTAGKNLKKAGNTLKSNLGGSGLSKKQKRAVKKAIKNGKEVNLTKFKEGSKGYMAAIKYNSALTAKEKALSTYNDSKEDYASWKRTSTYNKFENIQTDYENKLGLIDAKIQNLDDSIANIEASGATVDNSWYKSKKAQVNERKKSLEAEEKALKSALAAIPKGTEEWYKANDEINQVNSSIAECTKTQYELNDAIAEGNKKILENKMNGIQDIIDEEEFLLGLIEHEDSIDSDTGIRTEAGNARLRSYSIDYYASKNKIGTASKELQRLQNMKKNKQYGANYEYSSLEALNNAIESAIKTQRDEITSLYSYEKKIVDEMKNAYQSQLEVLQKLIDKKKESLEAEKDLYDYQKQIKEKTKNIDTIKKQIAAYQGDTSEEAKAQLQKLQVSLNEAQDDLKDTEYDRYISDQSKMLDNLQKEYQEWMEKHIKNFEDLLKEGLGIGESVDGSYLATIAKNNGYNISNTDANKNGNVKTNVDNQTNKNGNTETVKPSTSTISTKSSSSAISSSSSSAPKTKSDKTKATEYIKKNKSKPKKPIKQYSYVNQKISALTKGYVLSSGYLKGLAKTLNVATDGNYTKSGKLAKKLKSIGLAGFSKGGIVSIESLGKQVKANGDDGIASVKNGEAILTPAQTEMFKQFVQNMQNYPNSNVNKLSTNLTNLSKTLPNNIDYGGVNFNFELNNVTNGDEFIKEIQKNQKLQKAIQSVSIDKINGGGRLSVNRIK